jgi:hypothetical protein
MYYLIDRDFKHHQADIQGSQYHHGGSVHLTEAQSSGVSRGRDISTTTCPSNVNVFTILHGGSLATWQDTEGMRTEKVPLAGYVIKRSALTVCHEIEKETHACRRLAGSDSVR